MPVIRLKAVLIVLSLLFIFAACKKNSSSNSRPPAMNYYVKFTLDGNDVLFENTAEGNMNVVDARGNFTFTGAALKVAFVAASNNLSLIVSNTTSIKTNTTYVNFANTTSGYERAAIATVAYIDAAGIAFSSWGDEFKNTGVISDSKITFTEISTTNLKGNFSGTAYKSISGTAEKHIITKGEFNLKRR